MSAVNPWFVDSLQTFWQLKCPECTFDSKEEDTFKYHAVTKHPMSLVLFGKEFNYPVENPIIDLIKTEISQEKCFDKSFNSVNDNYEQESEVDDNEIENIEITDDQKNENSSEILASSLHEEFVIKEECSELYEDLENKNLLDTNISVKRQLKRKCNKERHQEEEFIPSKKSDCHDKEKIMKGIFPIPELGKNYTTTKYGKSIAFHHEGYTYQKSKANVDQTLHSLRFVLSFLRY
jgi:hypothetical protein